MGAPTEFTVDCSKSGPGDVTVNITSAKRKTVPVSINDNGDDTYTGQSLSEALFFASNNPQYDDRLFIELQVQYMKVPSSEHGENMLCTEIVFFLSFKTISVHNMFSPCSAKLERLT